MINLEELTTADKYLIQYALEELLRNAVTKLESKQLGDLERGMVEKTKTQTRELLIKIEA